MNNEDMSDVFEKLNKFTQENNISPDMVNNLFNTLNNNSNQNNSSKDSNTSSDNSFNFNNIDFENILKMKSIIDKMNSKDDPRSNLLQSLKPYLSDSKKSKVDQYIQLMNMSKVLEVFSFIGGDQKNGL